MLEDFKAFIGAPHTRKIADVADPCPNCGSAGCYLACHYGSMMRAEMMIWKCPKCGPVKRLYSKRPEARYEASYWKWLTGDYRKKQLAPKREV